MKKDAPPEYVEEADRAIIVLARNPQDAITENVREDTMDLFAMCDAWIAAFMLQEELNASTETSLLETAHIQKKEATTE